MIRSIDIPTMYRNTHTIVVPRSIDERQCARAVARFTSSVTSASHSGSVVAQSYQSSLFFITFCNLLNKIGKIMVYTMKGKANAETGFVNQGFTNRRHFLETFYVDKCGMTVRRF
jgi:hypothetical protein